MKFRPHLALWGLLLALVAGSSAYGKELKYCIDGAVVEPKSALGKQLYAPPKSEALDTFGQVEDPTICDFSHKGKVDYTAPPRCEPICEKRRSQLGDLLSCIHETVDGALNDSSAKYGQFVVNTSGLPIRFLVPSSPNHNIRGLLLSDSDKRSPIKISINEDDRSVDIGKPEWNKSWTDVTERAVAACNAAPAKVPARDCSRLTQSGLAFAAKLKLLEKGVSLANKLKEKTGIDLPGLSTCDPANGNFGLGAPKKPPLTANKKPKNLPAGTGKLDPIFRECQNLSLGSIDVSCADLTASGLGPFTGEVQKILNNPGTLVNYIDLLRIRSVAALMKTHRETVGVELAGLPPSCDRFKAGIAAAEKPLNEDEKKKFEATTTAEKLAGLQKIAQRLVTVIDDERAANAVPKRINCHKDGQAMECDENPAYPAAQARIEEDRRTVRATLARYPLLSARDDQPKDRDDLPAVTAFANGTADTLPKVAADARKKISAAITKNISKACNNSNDSGGWAQSSDSISWIDLVTLPGLTSDTIGTPPFGVFSSMQACLKRKANDITSGRDEAQVLVAIGCLAGTVMSGPFVGVPCAGIMLAMAGSDLMLASNRFDWIRECQELAKGPGEKAFCSSDDYLSAREQYDSAIEAAVMAGAFATIEAGHGLLKVAKFLTKAKLLKYAAEIGAAGNDATKLSTIEKAITEEAAASPFAPTVEAASNPASIEVVAAPAPAQVAETVRPGSAQVAPTVRPGSAQVAPTVRPGSAQVAETVRPGSSGASDGAPTGRPTARIGAHPNGENPFEVKIPRAPPAPKFEVGLGAVEEKPVVPKKVKPNGKVGMDRVEFGYSAEKGAPQVTAPEIELKSPVPDGKPLVEPEVKYSNEGKSPETLVREGTGAASDAKLKPLGQGGFQSVFEDPVNPGRAAKVYDRELIWQNMQKQIRKRITRAIKGRQLGEAMKYKRMLDEMKASIPKGGKVPPEIDRKIAVLIQRQRVLARTVSGEMVPRLNNLMGGEIKVTMVEGLQTVSETGYSNVEKITVGQIPDAPAGTRWVEGDRYAAKLKEGTPEWDKFRKVEARWNSSVAPFEKQMAGSGEKLGLSLKKGDQGFEFDFGTPGDNMSNTYLKVDAKGNVLEIKISDI